MPGRQLGTPIKGSLGAGGISMIIDRGMIPWGRLTGPIFKALVRVTAARIQDG